MISSRFILEGNTFIIALNASETTQPAEVTYEGQKIPDVVLGEASDISVRDGRLKFKIPPRSGAVMN